MAIFDSIKRIWANLLALDDLMQRSGYSERYTVLQRNRAYYSGDQARQLKVRPMQADDNLVLNFVQLVVERSISLLFGQGVEFDLPGEAESQEQVYLDSVWAANKKGRLLHALAQYGGIYGTCYVKIIPEGVEYKGALYPRLISLNPMYMTVEADPNDKEFVSRYIMQYVTQEAGGEVGHREIISPVYAQLAPEDEGRLTSTITGWLIENYELKVSTQNKWELISSQAWQYPFPPVAHWQNLPQHDDIYGKSDVADILELQDRVNFVASNISKIIRYHAHPKTWGRGTGVSGQTSWGADEMVLLQGEAAQISNLEMQSDLSSSQAFLGALRQALFDISRTVDISSMADRLGALTNFGLRVLYQDSLAKLNTKRELYGEGILDINSRLLALAGMDADPGVLDWPDVLPVNDTEQAQADRFELEAGLASKYTVAKRRGLDYTQEEERLREEKLSSQTIGGALLADFERNLPFG